MVDPDDDIVSDSMRGHGDAKIGDVAIRGTVLNILL